MTDAFKFSFRHLMSRLVKKRVRSGHRKKIYRRHIYDGIASTERVRQVRLNAVFVLTIMFQHRRGSDFLKDGMWWYQSWVRTIAFSRPQILKIQCWHHRTAQVNVKGRSALRFWCSGSKNLKWARRDSPHAALQSYALHSNFTWIFYMHRRNKNKRK